MPGHLLSKKSKWAGRHKTIHTRAGGTGPPPMKTASSNPTKGPAKPVPFVEEVGRSLSEPVSRETSPGPPSVDTGGSPAQTLSRPQALSSDSLTDSGTLGSPETSSKLSKMHAAGSTTSGPSPVAKTDVKSSRQTSVTTVPAKPLVGAPRTRPLVGGPRTRPLVGGPRTRPLVGAPRARPLVGAPRPRVPYTPDNDAPAGHSRAPNGILIRKMDSPVDDSQLMHRSDALKYKSRPNLPVYTPPNADFMSKFGNRAPFNGGGGMPRTSARMHGVSARQAYTMNGVATGGLHLNSIRGSTPVFSSKTSSNVPQVNGIATKKHVPVQQSPLNAQQVLKTSALMNGVSRKSPQKNGNAKTGLDSTSVLAKALLKGMLYSHFVATCI